MDFSTSITVGGQQVILVDEKTIKNSSAWMKANAIYCPLGHSASEAWLLMTGSAIRALAVNSYHNIVWTVKTGSTSTTNTFKNFKLVIAERLLHGGNNNDASLYLCHFADARYFCNINSDTGTLVANLRSYAQYNDYLTGSEETWTTLLTDLWNACGLLGAWPGLPGGLPIDSVPETTHLTGLNAYKALTAVLNQLDCAIAHNPIAGTYSIVQLGQAQAIAANTDRLVWDGEPISGNSDIAAYVRVYFNKHYKNYGQEPDTEIDDNWAYNGATSSLLVATGVTGAVGTIPLWDDMPWVLGEGGTNTNSSALTTRANNRKSRYVTRNNVTVVHKIWSSIISTYLPGGQIRAVLWRNWGDLGNKFGGTKTEIIAGPDLLGSYRGSDNKGMGLYWDSIPPEKEQYASPDLGRRSYPNYARLPNIIQVCHCEGAVRGTTVSPNGDGLHRAKVKRIVNGVMETLETCWLLFVDDYDNLMGDVDAIQGQYYGPARLTGIVTSGGETYPLYLVRNYESGDASTDEEATTTTTTMEPCSGRAKWIWNDLDQIWELDSDTCAEGTTTSTTTTTPEGTTTTTADLCECTPVTTTTTTDTTTTTTPEPSSCSPVYPRYCGSVDGECTYTDCSYGYVYPVVSCTTTTSDCNCDTTTTTPDCASCSDWVCTPSGWIMTADNCTGSCLATSPTSDCDTVNAENCTTGSGGSSGGGCTSCEGDCEWIYYNNYGWWLYANSCVAGTCEGCQCVRPTHTGTHCGHYTGPCQAPEPTDPDDPINQARNCAHCYSTTTSTPSLGSCSGFCKWEWNTGTEVWDQVSDSCASSCECLYPAYAGVDSCEVTWTNCGTEITTTTTSEPTTTTTGEPCVQCGAITGIDCGSDCAPTVGCGAYGQPALPMNQCYRAFVRSYQQTIPPGFEYYCDNTCNCGRDTPVCEEFCLCYNYTADYNNGFFTASYHHYYGSFTVCGTTVYLAMFLPDGNPAHNIVFLASTNATPTPSNSFWVESVNNPGGAVCNNYITSPAGPVIGSWDIDLPMCTNSITTKPALLSLQSIPCSGTATTTTTTTTTAPP